MTHRKRAIWTERLLLGLILASLCATLNLLVVVHRHSETRAPSPTPDSTFQEPPLPVPTATSPSNVARSDASSLNDVVSADSAVVQKLPESPIALTAPEDPTKKALAALETATTKEMEAGRRADRRTVLLQAACESAFAESQRWKRREMLVRQQIAGLTERAERLDRDAQSLDAERDVLARERDALKAALTKASQRSGYAVLPYKGPNGTWQRPIVLECTAGGVKLQLQGRTFTALELSPLIHRRSSPFVRAIAQELLHIRSADTPDGAPAVPYLVFLVRPDGIRAYYEARTCLEPLGIAFGYELIEQDLVVDVPDLDDLTTWDGSVPLEMPLEPAAGPNSNVAARSSADKGGTNSSPKSEIRNPKSEGSSNWPRGDQGLAGGWPERSSGRGKQAGAGATNPDNSSPEDFVWPGRGRHAVDEDGSGSGAAGLHTVGDQIAGNGAGQPVQMPGGAGAGLQAGGTSPGSSVDQQSSSGGPLDVAGSSTGSIGTGGPTGNRSGSSPFQQGNGGLTGLGQRPLGAGSGPRGTGGLNALPDLEPAGDGGAPLSLQARLGSSTQQAAAPGLDAGGQSQGSGPGSVMLGTAATGGTGSSSATGDGATSSGARPEDPSQASGGNQTDVVAPPAGGTGSTASDPRLGGKFPALDPPPNDAGTTPGNPSSSSGGSAPPSQPMIGQLAPYPSDLQESHGSSSGVGLASSFSATSQPPLASSLAGEFSPSSSSTNPSFGMPSSSSTSTAANTSSSMGGMPLGSTPSTSSPQSSSSSFSWGQDAGSNSDSKTEMIVPPRPRPAPPMGSIEVPFEIVVVCRRYDVLLHPGGYRLTLQAMREQGAGNDGLLAREIRAIVRRRVLVDPLIRPKPAIRFLVETYGAQAFWTARRQLLFSLPEWPMSLQVSSSQEPHVFSEETW